MTRTLRITCPYRKECQEKTALHWEKYFLGFAAFGLAMPGVAVRFLRGALCLLAIFSLLDYLL